jgi:serine/threonine protein phosphatase PrpC
MRLIIKANSNIGQIRSKNEDMIIVGNEIFRDDLRTYNEVVDSNGTAFIVGVADGMGGHKGGDYASEFVLTKLNSILSLINKNLDYKSLKEDLLLSIKFIHSELLNEGLSYGEKKGMGSTFAGVLFYNHKVYLINIGDSRVYRLRLGILSQLSKDHSLSELSGDPSAPKNIILNSFGAGQNIFMDFEDLTERIMNDDIILICSDGLNNELSDEDIERVIQDKNEHIALVDEANKMGGRDNISVIVLHYLDDN